MSYPKFHGIQLALGSAIANAVVESLASDPTPIVAARIWYNSTEKALKFSSLDAGGAVIVETAATGADVQEALDAIAALGARVSAIEGAYIKKDGSVAFTGNVNLGSNKLTNVGNGTASTDAVNYGQLQSALGALANAFSYQGTVNGGADVANAYDLSGVSAQTPGSYYKVSQAGYFKLGAEGEEFFANLNDGLVFNTASGVDIIDNTNSTVAGTPSFVSVTGTADTGYTVDLDAAFKGRVSTLESGLAAEITRAEGAETTLQSNITAETTRATTAEAGLSTAIGNETTRATAAESALDGKIDGEITRATAAESTLSGKIGDLSTLTTTSKSSLVGAINEVKAGGSAADAKIGDLSTLTTTEKGTVVGAINEVNAAVAAEASRAQGAETTLSSSIAAEVTRAQGVEGSLAALTTDAKTNLVVAINEVDANADAAAAAAAAASAAAAAEATRAQGVEGSLAALTTDAKSTLVAAINEVDAHADAAAAAVAAETSRAQGVEGSLASLTTTAKGNLVAAVNEVNAAVAAEAARAAGVEGSLAALTTDAKTNLVAAINEVKAAAGEGTGALKTAINAQRYTQVAATAALVHEFQHNLNSQFVQVSVWVKGDDNVFRNDIVAVEETNANKVTVTLTESRIVKVAIQALDQLA